MSLGGIRDEAEIRGHRRTYIGALPGRLVRALRDAGTMNPVIMLDEVDKVGADWRGDPSSALLEVLDPAQNHSFRDHYLDVELDLSEVFFIATGNMAETIPGPLLDRMEVIRFDGYTTEEKVAIARGYLWPRQVERNGPARGRGLGHRRGAREGRRRVHARGGRPPARARARDDPAQDGDEDRLRRGEAPVEIDEDVVREALGRQKVFRETAERTAVPGVATGLAATATGGDVLFIEATSHRDGDKLVLTGQLGDVMKESAQIAISTVRALAPQLGIEEDAFEDRAFHLHVPAGAIPKDGPSAGITMATAVASLLTERPVKHTVGMTGEITLQGRVLPIGGLKQKVLAAHAAGITDIILPERNRADLDELPENVKEDVTFHPVMSHRRGAEPRARGEAGGVECGGESDTAPGPRGGPPRGGPPRAALRGLDPVRVAPRLHALHRVPAGARRDPAGDARAAARRARGGGCAPSGGAARARRGSSTC